MMKNTILTKVLALILSVALLIIATPVYVLADDAGLSEIPWTSYTCQYGADSRIMYSESEATVAGVPSGYSGYVMAISRTSSMSLGIDFSSQKIPVSSIEEMTFRVYCCSDISEVRAIYSGSNWIMRYTAVAGQWMDITLKSDGTNFYGTNSFDSFADTNGYLARFTLGFRKTGTTLGNCYVDHVTVKCKEVDNEAPVIGEITNEFYTYAGTRPMLDIPVTDNDSVEVAKVWTEGALDSYGKLTAGEHTMTLVATDPAGNTTEKSVTFYVSETDESVGAIHQDPEWTIPKIPSEQAELVSKLQSGITELGEITEDTIFKNYEAANSLISKYDSLSEDALIYLTNEEKVMLAEIRKLVEEAPVFDINEGKEETTTITGDEVEGYTMEFTGGSTRVVTRDSYPIQNLSFDFGFLYTQYAANKGYGEFGITQSSVDELTGKSGAQTITFLYYVNTDNKGTKLDVYVKNSVGQAKLIGRFPYATYRPGDPYWARNISNFSFVKADGHWHLAVDGNICNNVTENFEFSCLEKDGRVSFFENNEDVHIYVGAYDSANVGGTAFFKPLTIVTEDGMWESTAVDSYIYGSNEYRGQGNRDTTVHGAIPAKAVGNKEDGYVVDFTGTNGYAQTTDGYDLKTTTFKVAPRVESDTQPNILHFYIGFTSDPSNIQYHSAKPDDSIEFHMWSVKSDNATYGDVITNKNCLATPSGYFVGKVCTYQTHNFYNYTNNEYTNNPIIINFVQATGPDGKLHWYMQTSISNAKKIVMGDIENDKYLQFDSIIDNPVYFRMGTNTVVTDDFGMYCKVEGNVITAAPLYSNITDTNFAIQYDSGAVIDGVEFANGSIIDSVGERFIEYTSNGIAHSRRLVIYKAGDTNADNEVDIRDLVALKKNLVGIRDFDSVGNKAADLNNDSSLDSLDLSEVRKVLLKR